MHNELGGDMAGAADLDCPKGYSIPCGITPSCGEKKREGHVQRDGVCLPMFLLHVMKPGSPRAVSTAACLWNVVN